MPRCSRSEKIFPRKFLSFRIRAHLCCTNRPWEAYPASALFTISFYCIDDTCYETSLHHICHRPLSCATKINAWRLRTLFIRSGNPLAPIDSLRVQASRPVTQGEWQRVYACWPTALGSYLYTPHKFKQIDQPTIRCDQSLSSSA